MPRDVASSPTQTDTDTSVRVSPQAFAELNSFESLILVRCYETAPEYRQLWTPGRCLAGVPEPRINRLQY